MKFLAIETELKKVDSENESSLLKEEAEKVLTLSKDGIIKEIYFNEDNCAVIILECDSLESATKHLNKLPLIKNGFIKFTIMYLKPYTGFDRLA